MVIFIRWEFALLFQLLQHTSYNSYLVAKYNSILALVKYAFYYINTIIYVYNLYVRRKNLIALRVTL